LSKLRWTLSSWRKPRMPPKVLGRIPTDDDMLAVREGIPNAKRVGKLTKVPPPATPLEMPAAHPAMKMKMIFHGRGMSAAITI